MSLYKRWTAQAYEKDGKSSVKFWNEYIPIEQKIYEEILGNKLTNISGTVKELAERFNMSAECVCGFVDGINETQTTAIEVEELEEDSLISIDIDFEKLYKKMVEYKANHLLDLPQWDNIFDEETRKKFYSEQKKSGTFIRETPKVGRNDPCICGSGKKYKKCCGAAS